MQRVQKKNEMSITPIQSAIDDLLKLSLDIKKSLTLAHNKPMETDWGKLINKSITLINDADKFKFPSPIKKMISDCVSSIEKIILSNANQSRPGYIRHRIISIFDLLKKIIIFIRFVQFIVKHHPLLATKLLCKHISLSGTTTDAYITKDLEKLSQEDLADIKEQLTNYTLIKLYNDGDLYLGDSLANAFLCQIRKVNYPESFFSEFYQSTFELSPPNLNKLSNEVLIELYLNAVRMQGCHPHFFCFCTPTEIYEIITKQKTGNCLILQWDQFYLEGHPLSTEQVQALRTSIVGISTEQEQQALKTSGTKLGIVYDRVDYQPPIEHWKMLCSLISNQEGIHSLSFEIKSQCCPIWLTNEILPIFKILVQHIQHLDLSPIQFTNNEADTDQLAEAIKHCKKLHFGAPWQNDKATLTTFLKKINVPSLSLNNMCLGEENDLSFLPLFNAIFLDLSHNKLHQLSLGQWATLCEKLIHVRNLDLSSNNFADWEMIQLIEFIKLLSQLPLRWINFSGCGFDVCSEEKWHAIYDALSTFLTHCQFAPISDLSVTRQNDLKRILNKTLLSTCIHVIWRDNDRLTETRNTKPVPSELLDQFTGVRELKIL